MKALGLLVALLPLWGATRAAAQTDAAAAEALFEQGKTLMKDGRVAEACLKFQESYRLDPGGGILINLAQCHEKQGKTATAWAEFKEALGLAIKAGRSDREQFARERIAQLEKSLSRLLIEIPPETRTQGLEIRRGGALLGEGSWGEALPVDPGPHQISASAPGHQPHSYPVVVEPGQRVVVKIAPLQPLPAPTSSATSSTSAPAAPTAPPPRTAAPPSNRRTAGLIIGAVGVASLWVGGIFGVRAIQKRSASDTDCPGGACNARGWEAYEQAQSAARYANVGLALGVVGAGLGTWLILSSRSPGSPSVGLGPGGVSVQRSW